MKPSLFHTKAIHDELQMLMAICVIGLLKSNNRNFGPE